MPDYERLGRINATAGRSGDWRAAVEFLLDTWIAAYGVMRAPDLVVTESVGFSYLHDRYAERLVAAWGVSRAPGTRAVGTMYAHGVPSGGAYHLGVHIPHRVGAIGDLALVPELGRIDPGPFRALAMEAVATPGSLYFAYWSYPAEATEDGRPARVPDGVDRGMMVPGRAPRLLRGTTA